MLKIPYAKGPDGEKYHCTTPKAALPPTVACGDCGGMLIARQGEINVWHFAHATKQDCDGGRGARESKLHIICKELLAKGLNEGKIKRGSRWAKGKAVCEDRIWLRTLPNNRGYQPDVGLHPLEGSGELYTALEVKNTHGKGADAAKKVHDLNHRMFEVDVSKWHDLVLEYELSGESNPQPIYDAFNAARWRVVKWATDWAAGMAAISEAFGLTWVDMQGMTDEEYRGKVFAAYKAQEKAALDKKYEEEARQWGTIPEQEDDERWEKWSEQLGSDQRIRDEIENARNEIEALESKIEAVRGEAGEPANEAKKYRIEAADLRAKSRRIRADIDAIEAEIGGLPTEIRRLEAQIEDDRKSHLGQFSCEECGVNEVEGIMSNDLYAAVLKQFPMARVSRFKCRECPK